MGTEAHEGNSALELLSIFTTSRIRKNATSVIRAV